MVDGDFAMYEDEVQGVLKALRAAGINVVAIHNHMTHEQPRVVFLHYWAVGPAERVLFSEGPRLISATLDGGARAELTQAHGETVRDVRFTPDGRTAVFELPLSSGNGLYEAATDGSQPLRLLSGPAGIGGVAAYCFDCGRSLAITPDGAFASYIGDLDEEGVYELFASSLGAAPRRPVGPGETRRR